MDEKDGDLSRVDNIVVKPPRRKSSLVLVRMHNTFLDFCETSPDLPVARRRFSSSMRRSCTDPRVLISDDIPADSIVTLPCNLLVGEHNKENRSWSDSYVKPGEALGKKELNHKVFVGGLSSSTDEATLYEFMTRFGPIKNVTVKRNPLTGQSRRYAFVKFYGTPSPWIFQHSWVLEDHTIRISKYQVSSEWKNHYYSDECEE